MIEYRVITPPRRQRDYTGLRIRAAREITTGALVIPQGSLGSVTYSSGVKVEIIFDPCECCGVSARYRWTPSDSRKAVEFVEPVAP
jgi:hypothetical protein